MVKICEIALSIPEDAERDPGRPAWTRLACRTEDGGYWDQVAMGTLPDGPIDPEDERLDRPKLVRLLEEAAPGSDLEDDVFAAFAFLREIEAAYDKVGVEPDDGVIRVELRLPEWVDA